MDFHARLKELRLQSFMMQKEIAMKLGVSVRTFQGWETGRTEPNIAMLIKIADLFYVSIDWLLGHEVMSPPAASVEESQTNPPAYPNN